VNRKLNNPERAEFQKLYGQSPMVNWSKCISVEQTPGKVSGAWVFKGTRVPVYALFENLNGGATLEKFIEHFPGVAREQVDDLTEFLLYSLEQKSGPRGLIGSGKGAQRET